MQPTTKVPEASLRSRLFGQSYEMYAQAAGITVDEWKAETKFSGIDLGWVILCVGMSLGAGIVFLPIQVGLSGLLIFALVALVGYPIAYAHHGDRLGRTCPCRSLGCSPQHAGRLGSHHSYQRGHVGDYF